MVLANTQRAVVMAVVSGFSYAWDKFDPQVEFRLDSPATYVNVGVALLSGLAATAGIEIGGIGTFNALDRLNINVESLFGEDSEDTVYIAGALIGAAMTAGAGYIGVQFGFNEFLKSDETEETITVDKQMKDNFAPIVLADHQMMLRL